MRRDRFTCSVRKTILLLLAGAAVSLHAEQKFSAADIPGLHLRKPGTVVITNETLAHHAHARIGEAIEAAARANNLDSRLLDAIAHRESAMNENAVSRAGAVGVMQLMPRTAAMLGVNAWDTRDNIFGAAHYLRRLLDTFNGDIDLTLAAYNAGPGAVLKYGGVPPYRETQAYVKAVRAAYDRALR